MLHLAQFIAIATTTIFAGAAVYINLVEHPARMGCSTELAATEWAPSYRRATFMAAKVLVPKSSRDSPLFLTIAASVRFLGGMNLAFAALSLLMLLGFLASTDRDQRAALLLVLVIAHGSQFYFNVPIARGGGRQGEALWDVHQGPMKFIFRVDATLMIANAILCLFYFFAR